jgi:hypothetical protein
VIGAASAYYGSDAIRWWPDVDGQEFDGDSETPRHEKLIPAAYLVWMRNQPRRAQWFHYARAYGGFDQALSGLVGVPDPSYSLDAASIPYNVIRSSTNTLTAKVIKNRPDTMYLPVGGDQSLQRRIKYLNRFVTGLNRVVNYYPKRHVQVRDAGLFGTGDLLICRDRRRVSVENVFRWEEYVDPIDARYNDPRSLYLIRYLDKGVLKMRYGYDEQIDRDDDGNCTVRRVRNDRLIEAIESAPVLDEAFQPVADVYSVSNRCTVIEAWHLPSGDGAKDGRHTVCLLDETLFDEPWERPEFPISRLVKDPAISGWYGIGLGDELSGFQDRISMMDERLEYAHRIVGGQIWLKPEGSQIYDTDFNDAIGPVVSHTPGMAPTNINPQPVHEQTYDYFRGLIPDSYGFAGISQMSAQSQKPPGVTAALALQTLDDIETDRFVGFERDDEECVVESSRLMLHVVREIADKYGDFTVLSAGRGSGEEIRWKRDVDVREDSYVTQGWAISLMPKTPAAKMQRVLEFGANGYFNKAQVLKYTGLPDTTEEEELMLSAQNAADAQIGAMLEHADPNAPEAFIPPTEHQDSDYALSRAQSFYNKLQVDSISRGTYHDPLTQKRLANLDTYMKLAKGISDQAKNEAAQMQAQAQMAAQAQQAQGQQAAQLGASAPPQLTQGQPQPAAPLAPAAPLSPASPA